MTDLTPGLIALKNELMPAFRRDHHRRQRRRKLVRTSAISFAAFAALSGSALAAGSALGVIDLGGGATAAPVTTLPVWNGTTGTFDSGTANGNYIYELAGVGEGALVCGPNDPDVATFLTSSQPLTQSDLEGLLDPTSLSGLSSPTDMTALGITGESSGCFPASVAGPLGTPQTPAQAAAGEALTARIKDQMLQNDGQALTARIKDQMLENARRLNLKYVTVTHDGKRVIVKLHGKALALAFAHAPKAK
jgi:hypothetical protein